MSGSLDAPPLVSGERTPDTHSVGGWVHLGAGLDVVGDRKLCHPCRESNTGNSARSLDTILITLSRRHFPVLGPDIFTSFLRIVFTCEAGVTPSDAFGFGFF